jgi:hypothetical protein
MVACGVRAGREDGSSNALMESAIHLVFVSALSTFTLTICPVFTASEGSLMKRFESSLMWTSPSASISQRRIVLSGVTIKPEVISQLLVSGQLTFRA